MIATENEKITHDDMAREWKQVWRKEKNILRCGSWNVTSCNIKDQEFLLELGQHKIDI